MNYLLFHQSGAEQFPKIPDGLKQLMSDISREVLREQPENIYDFIADYLEDLELTREHTGSNYQNQTFFVYAHDSIFHLNKFQLLKMS